MRIVSLAPSNTEILFAIGAGAEIVGRTAYCDFPPEAKKIPKLGDWANPDPGAIKRLKPDLVLTSTVVQERLAKTLDSEGLPVLHLSPRDLGGVFGSILDIGGATGRLARAEALVEGMARGLDEIKAEQDASDRRPRLYIEEWHDPPFVSGNWVPELAEIAGAEWELIRKGSLSRKVTADEVRSFDPEIIALSICGVKLSREALARREGWGGISAVKNENIVVLDDSLLNRPGPRLVLGCRAIRDAVTSFSSRGACSGRGSRGTRVSR
ncbi:MAG: cobalamin-binding protein [Candidatus Micrarchaeota archaeon]